jgi:hypothetical protein
MGPKTVANFSWQPTYAVYILYSGVILTQFTSRAKILHDRHFSTGETHSVVIPSRRGYLTPHNIHDI